MIKRFICFIRDHRPDFKTLKCVVCGKQFRFVSMDEYVKGVNDEKSRRL
jgi:hypothetical protein